MKENLSQRKLLEVLTHEIEVLRKTSANINETAPIIEKQLKQLLETKITATLDTHKLEYMLNEHKDYIKKRVIIPSWFLIFITIIFGILAIQSLWLYFKVFVN